MSAVRLDKYLAQSGERTRSQAVRAIRDGLARINGTTVRDPAAKVGEGDEVTLAGEPVYDEALQYYMLHKPAGRAHRRPRRTRADGHGPGSPQRFCIAACCLWAPGQGTTGF